MLKCVRSGLTIVADCGMQVYYEAVSDTVSYCCCARRYQCCTWKYDWYDHEVVVLIVDSIIYCHGFYQEDLQNRTVSPL